MKLIKNKFTKFQIPICCHYFCPIIHPILNKIQFHKLLLITHSKIKISDKKKIKLEKYLI